MNKKALIAAVVTSTAIAVPAVADAATYARNQSPVVAQLVKSQMTSTLKARVTKLGATVTYVSVRCIEVNGSQTYQCLAKYGASFGGQSANYTVLVDANAQSVSGGKISVIWHTMGNATQS